ncbi:phytanoyl-CoA dioxygenase family protein [Flagellimonas marinaquae]
MNENAVFIINDDKRAFSTKGSAPFKYGENEVLSTVSTDITFNQPWYDQGYAALDFLDEEEFRTLKNGITQSIAAIVSKECSLATEGFTLEKYHEFVQSDAEHIKVISRTRDLFAEDFSFPIMDLIPRFEKLMGMGLTDRVPESQVKAHIIVRINRPQSNDFNPPHKDIYQRVDSKGIVGGFVNLWIPVAGVNEKSSLPLVPQSHLLKESQILRTFDRGTINGNSYSVRMVKSWNGQNNLVRSTVKDGQVLIFSGHLIHGLAVNDNVDLTRVALEFRLFKA